MISGGQDLNDVGKTARHIKALHCDEHAANDNDNAEDKVRPGNGLEACGENEGDAGNCKTSNQHIHGNAGHAGVELSEGAEVGDAPAKGNDGGHHTGKNTDGLVAAAERLHNVRHGDKVVAAQPFCNQRDEQQRGGAEHAIEQNGQAEVIGVADMTDQNAAAHCGGKLSADDNVVREITTADLPVGQIGFLSSAEDVCDKKRETENQNGTQNDQYGFTHVFLLKYYTISVAEYAIEARGIVYSYGDKTASEYGQEKR